MPLILYEQSNKTQERPSPGSRSVPRRRVVRHYQKPLWVAAYFSRMYSP